MLVARGGRRAGPAVFQSPDEKVHVRDDDEGWGQHRPRVKFPDEAVALCLPIEVAVALYFAKGVAVGTRGHQRSKPSQGWWIKIESHAVCLKAKAAGRCQDQ